jgi:hypothetical protein
MMRRFRLIRSEDVSGVSGTGAVAEGVAFSSGKVALSWRSDVPTVTVYDAIADLERIHGHEGRTRIEWVDPLDEDETAARRRRRRQEETAGRTAFAPVRPVRARAASRAIS